MLLTRLKEETRELHERTERSLGLLDRMPTAAEYAGLLRAFYGYHLPIEERLAALPWADLGFDWPARRKVPLLERDLLALGDDRNSVPWCPDVPPLDTVPQALGCLYVLEGATLGGQFISRHLALGPDGPLPTAFFASYGSEVGRMWKAFGAFATAYAGSRAVDDEVVASACQTFAILGDWLAARDSR